MMSRSILFLLFLLQIQISLSEDQVLVTKVDGGKEDVMWSVTLPQGFTWWKLDMETNHLVSEIHIMCGNDTEELTVFRNLTISVASKEGEERVCFSVVDSLTPDVTHSFTCVEHPRYARYVIIKRPDGMPLAEVKVFAKKIETEGPASLLAKESTSQAIGLVKEQYVVVEKSATEQCGTWNNHFSWMAVDGNLDTYSVACVTCDQTLSAGPGWWQVDLERERAVAGVSIFSSKDTYNSKYFNDIEIFVGSTRSTDSRDSRLCYDFSSNDAYPPGHRFDFRCLNAPLIGRFVTIKRKKDARFRVDAVALAEVKILENTDHPGLSFETKIYDNASIILEKNSANEVTVERPIQATQSGTWNNHNASLALDGNSATWSMADTTQDPKYKGLVAWWQADLGGIYKITGLSIVPSPDPTNSQYMRDISVDVTNTSAAVDFGNPIQCANYRGTIILSQSIELNCWMGIYGRYLVIRRVSNSLYKPEALTLAEVRISYN